MSTKIDTSDRAHRLQQVATNWRLAFVPGGDPQWAVCRLDDEGNEIEGSEVRFVHDAEVASYVVGYMETLVEVLRS